jgi:hypothetical protein
MAVSGMIPGAVVDAVVDRETEAAGPECLVGIRAPSLQQLPIVAIRPGWDRARSGSPLRLSKGVHQHAQLPFGPPE